MFDMPISKSLVYPRTHWFHIPVMGTGHSIDTPLRVARWGISSVISLVDDVMIEQVHKLHRERRGQPFAAVSPSDPDARSKRIQAYLDFLHDEIEAQMAELRAQEFAPGTDKTRYFEMLPASSPLRQDYERLLALPQGAERDALAADLTARIEAGSIDANIMTKLDRQTLERDGTPRPPQYSDAKTALRGFATSKVAGNLVLSAGINPTLYGCLEEFQDFYRQDGAEARKGIVVKVSDYRSALTQGRFLAKKGVEVREFRIESGLNCGGHAFASEGDLMGPILEEFRANRAGFRDEFAKLIQGWYTKKSLPVPAGTAEHDVAVTAQGGLGTYGENRRLLETFGLDAVGWASPFLLVPESTPIDAYTRQLLARATSADLYTSDVSPLGVPFNNVRGSSAEIELKRRVELGKPGSPCPKGFISLNTEFEGKPICTASAEYQARKLETVGGLASPAAAAITVKECICHQLGNGALEFIRSETRELRGETESTNAPRLPVSVCPGPNIAWFNRTYSLSEMIDHIYGRIPSLVPAHRPHAFATEIQLYVEHFQKLVARSDLANAKEFEKIRNYRVNFSASLVWNRTFATNRPFDDENLPSLLEAIESAEAVIAELWDEISERAEKPLIREAQ